MFLGFLKGYPSYMIGDVSCGTGFAGIFATTTLLSCKALGISNEAIFLAEAPSILLYFFAFKWLVDQKKKYRFVPEQDGTETDESTEVESLTVSASSSRNDLLLDAEQESDHYHNLTTSTSAEDLLVKAQEEA